MASLTIEEAQSRLREVLAGMLPGEEVTLTDDGRSLARLVREEAKPALRSPPGLCKGMVTYIAPEFDAPLEDTKEYME